MSARVVVAISALACALSLPACEEPPALGCAVADDCALGQACVNGNCVGGSTPTPLPTEGEGEEGEGEEGEGEEGEGEGDLAEGEGEEGEGEGDTGEGEGEEGEGEGDTGGEGEGEGDPCAGVVCPEFQRCFDGVCDYVGDVCDAFQGFGRTVDETDTLTLGISQQSNVYEHFNASADTRVRNGDYLLDAFDLDTSPMASVLAVIAADNTSRPQAGVRFEVTSTAFDPYIGVFNEAQCLVLDANDDIAVGDRTKSRVDIDRVELSPAPQLVVSTFGANQSGSYTIRTKPLLCGEEVDNLETFNRCGFAISRSGSTQTCEDNNPCARNPATNLRTGEFCCISTSAAAGGNACGRSTGEPITRIVETNPDSVCFGAQ
jgi:hypothetical protein